jgi:polysaccharide biosynthesis transport protein
VQENRQLPTPTPAVDLFVPADRFVSASKLHSQLQRWRLLFRRYWWLIALIMAVVVGPICYLTLKSPPAFASRARMWMAGKVDLREGRLYTEELINYFGTQAELLRSAAIHDRALVKSTGTNRPPNTPSPFKVKVTEASKSSILELRAIGPEPASTRAFLDQLMAEYLNFKRESREKSSDQTVASVNAEIKELASELEAQQAKLHAFQSSNNVVFLQEQGNSAGNYLASVNKHLANLRTELRLLQLLQPEQWIEAKSHPEAAGSPESLSDKTTTEEMLASLAGPQLDLFKATQQMQLLKAKRDELSKFLRPLHPKILKLNEDVKTQGHLAQVSRDEAVKQMNHRRQAVELEIKGLEAASAEWEAKAVEASRKMADYDRIRQDVQRLQTAYDKLLTLIQSVDLGRRVEQESIGILEPACAAMPVDNLKRNLAIAIAGSLLLGFGLLYLLAMLRDDFSTLAELTDHLSEPVVGQIPAISMKKPKAELALHAMEKQRFDFLEAFRNIRSSLLFMGNGKPKPKIIVAASSVPDEGKSTVALYLAATMARGNSRVLLVDADMRRGRLHKVFGAAPHPGLAEVLNREMPYAKAIVETGLQNLTFLPAGQAKCNPGELVLSAEWDLFLEQARDRYDYILVDTPPILATDDVAALAHKADGVLFIVRGCFTSARMARAALDTLRQRHVRVLGLIFNRVVSSRYERYHYESYQRAYNWDNKETAPAALVSNPSVRS